MDSITIKDIAQICGVGVSTVSRALNDHPDINQETKQKIIEVVKQYNFVPNNSARNLKITNSKTIAVLVKGLGNPFFMRMIGKIESEILKSDYSMELRHVDEKSDEVEVAIELVKEKKLQGIIFLGGIYTHSNKKLEGIGVPFVLCTIPLADNGSIAAASISVNDIDESYKIVKYLIDNGHKKIAFMGAPDGDISIGQLRLDGYKKALKEAKIKQDKALQWHSKEEDEIYTMENGYKMMKDALDAGLDFTAVFAIADTMAIGAMRALSDAGKRVPEDISIVGFDGIDMGAYCVPGLTTIRQPFDEMAINATNMLLDMIKDEKSGCNVMMEAKLLERESVRRIGKK